MISGLFTEWGYGVNLQNNNKITMYVSKKDLKVIGEMCSMVSSAIEGGATGKEWHILSKDATHLQLKMIRAHVNNNKGNNEPVFEKK